MPRYFYLGLCLSLGLHLLILSVMLFDWGEEKKPKPLPKHINASLIIKASDKKVINKANLEKKRKQAQAKKQAELKKQAEAKRKIKEEKKAEEKKRAEAKKQAEAEKKKKAKRQAELKKKAELKKQAELKRKAELKKKAEAKRKAEAKKKAEQKKKAEAKKRAEQKRKAEKKRKAEAKKKAAAEQRALEQALLEQTLADEDAEIQAQEDYFTAQQHGGLIRKSIEAHWRRPPSARNDMVVMLTIELLPNGELKSVAVLKSSGNEQFDASAINAVNKARRFPSVNSVSNQVFEQYFRRFTLKFSPEDLRL